MALFRPRTAHDVRIRTLNQCEIFLNYHNVNKRAFAVVSSTSQFQKLRTGFDMDQTCSVRQEKALFPGAQQVVDVMSRLCRQRLGIYTLLSHEPSFSEIWLL